MTPTDQSTGPLDLEAIRRRADMARDTLGPTTVESANDVPALLNELDRLQRWVNDLQSGMYINCVYCGHQYGPRKDTPVTMADVLKAHIEVCPQHPLSHAKAELDRRAAGDVEKARLELPDIEIVAEQVHKAWCATKLIAGVTSRKSETGEELIAPYGELSEPAKDLDRGTVKAVYAAITRLREAAK